MTEIADRSYLSVSPCGYRRLPVFERVLARLLRPSPHQQHDRSDLNDFVVLVQDLETDLQDATLRRLARPRLERRDPGADGITALHRRVELPGHAEQAERGSVDPVELRHQADRGRKHERPVRDAAAENALPGIFLIDVKRVVVADQ